MTDPNELAFSETVTAAETEIPPATAEVPDKFRNKDGSLNEQALLRSYTELESKIGKPAEAPVEGAEAATEGEGDFTLEEGATDPKDAFTPEQLESFGAKWTESGKLEPADYEAIRGQYGAGLPDMLIDNYFATQAALAGVQSQQVAQSVVETLGGAEEAERIRDWSMSSMSNAERAAFNKSMTEGNAADRKLALQGLKAQYQQANGVQGSRISGGGTGGLKPFRSNEEYLDAMRDPRFKSHKGYREQVSKRASISGF